MKRLKINRWARRIAIPVMTFIAGAMVGGDVDKNWTMLFVIAVIGWMLLSDFYQESTYQDIRGGKFDSQKTEEHV